MKKIGEFKTLPSSKIDDSYVSIGFECLDREVFDPELCYEPLGKTGIKYARVQTGWNKCEQTKGVIDFSWLDNIIDELLSRGVRPWFNVGYGNPLYMEDRTTPTCVGCVPFYYGDECWNAWVNFVRALAAHYKGVVEHFEIWNESDLCGFWYPKTPDGAEYARLISLTGKEIRDIIPNAKFGCCLSGANANYTVALAKNLKKGELDFYALHHYSRIPEKDFPYKLNLFRGIFEQYGHYLDYWVSESGYPSWTYPKHFMGLKRDDGNGNYASEHQQAVAQLRYFFMYIGEGIKRVSYFQMVDMWDKVYQTADSTQSKPAAQGILNGKIYTPKLSYYTISRLASLFTTDVKPIRNFMQVHVDLPPMETISVKEYAYKKGEECFYAYWLPTEIEAEIDVKDKCQVDISYIGECTPLTDLALVDMFTGEIFEIEKFDKSEYGVSIYDLPIKEYPLFICNKKFVL